LGQVFVYCGHFRLEGGWRPVTHKVKCARKIKTTGGIMGTSTQEKELAQLIVTSLNFEISPDEIEPEAPLYGEGLGLDSIDILELSLAISKTYGVQLKSEDADNSKIFSSLRSLNQHIQQHRPK
jgi:acyl carrier protein